MAKKKKTCLVDFTEERQAVQNGVIDIPSALASDRVRPRSGKTGPGEKTM